MKPLKRFLGYKIKSNQITVVSLGRSRSFGAAYNKRRLKLEKVVKSAALSALKVLKQSNVYLEIYLAGASRMRMLNKKFRGKNKAADVLSFPEPEGFLCGDKSLKPLGEVFLNIVEFKDGKRVVFLLVHGILHLLGYDHIRKNDRIKMEKKEAQLIVNSQ
ncbi:MAG: rRNA maturation RNase YbeY [Candidatus Brennerbacteria bacterium]|nr:rRNA maturation RNase YbeY [Candidatus Brennerbacteria bacterium]